MDPAKGDAKSEEEEHLIKSPSEKERKANERISPSTSSDDDDDGYSPEDLFQLDINKSPAANGQERRLQSGAQTNNFSSLIIDDDAVTTPDRPRSQTDAPDPERIASSIFIGTSSNSPAQWSAASNESLFSIQGGNSSFSKDHASLSGRSGGLSPSPPSPQPHPSLGSINVATFEARREELEEAANAKAIKDAVLQARSEGQRHSEEQRRRSSDGSAKSFQSFAFPILTGEGRNSSAKAESAQPLRPANKPQQQPQPETQLPKSSSAASPPAAASPSPPPPPPASAPKSKWLACCRCPSFC